MDKIWIIVAILVIAGLLTGGTVGYIAGNLNNAKAHKNDWDTYQRQGHDSAMHYYTLFRETMERVKEAEALAFDHPASPAVADCNDMCVVKISSIMQAYCGTFKGIGYRFWPVHNDPSIRFYLDPEHAASHEHDPDVEYKLDEEMTYKKFMELVELFKTRRQALRSSADERSVSERS